MFKKFKSTKKPKAIVENNALVLYLPNAKNPCIWRGNLDELSQTSVEIDQKENSVFLVTRDAHGIIKQIAEFDDENNANNALIIALNALMKNSNNGCLGFKNISIGKIIKWVIGILIILYVGLLILGPQTQQNPSQSQTTQEPTSALDEQGKIKTGVPVDVDELFSGDNS